MPCILSHTPPLYLCFSAHSFPLKSEPRWNVGFLPCACFTEWPYCHVMIFLSNDFLWFLIGEHISFNKSEAPAGSASWSGSKHLVQCPPLFSRGSKDYWWRTGTGKAEAALQTTWLQNKSYFLQKPLVPEGCWPHLVTPMFTFQSFSVLSHNIAHSCQQAHPLMKGRVWET